jgi:hypothetical protein
MRDHRTRSEQFRARFRPARRQVRPVGLVFLIPRSAVVTATGRGSRTVQAHLSFALSFAAPHLQTPARHRAPTVREQPQAAPGPIPTHRAVLPAARVIAMRDAPAGPASVARLSTVSVVARHETRIARVERVVTRTSAAPAATPGAGRPSSAPDWPPAAATRQPAVTTTPSGPTPAELSVITNHVLTAIDHRLIAHNERLGRG